MCMASSGMVPCSWMVVNVHGVKQHGVKRRGSMLHGGLRYAWRKAAWRSMCMVVSVGIHGAYCMESR